MIASVVALLLMLLFYIEAMNTEIQAIDNDGDSVDTDGDGYPDGQERLEGTDPNNAERLPVGVEPDPPEKWINEDDINWDTLKEAPIMLAKMMMGIVSSISTRVVKEIQMTMTLSVTLLLR